MHATTGHVCNITKVQDFNIMQYDFKCDLNEIHCMQDFDVIKKMPDLMIMQHECDMIQKNKRNE